MYVKRGGERERKKEESYPLQIRICPEESYPNLLSNISTTRDESDSTGLQNLFLLGH